MELVTNVPLWQIHVSPEVVYGTIGETLAYTIEALEYYSVNPLPQKDTWTLSGTKPLPDLVIPLPNGAQLKTEPIYKVAGTILDFGEIYVSSKAKQFEEYYSQVNLTDGFGFDDWANMYMQLK